MTDFHSPPAEISAGNRPINYVFIPGIARNEQYFEKGKNILPCPGQDSEQIRGQDGQTDRTECRDLSLRTDPAEAIAAFPEAE